MAIGLNAAAAWIKRAAYKLQQGGFTTTITSNNADSFAFFHFKRNILKRPELSEVLLRHLPGKPLQARHQKLFEPVTRGIIYLVTFAQIGYLYCCVAVCSGSRPYIVCVCHRLILLQNSCRDLCIIQKLNFASILMLAFSDFYWFPRFDANKLLFDNLCFSPNSPVKRGRGDVSPTLQQSSPAF